MAVAIVNKVLDFLGVETNSQEEYDEEYDCYRCSVDLDMDEAEQFMTYSVRSCPYYRPGDEYTIVRKQNWGNFLWKPILLL